MSQQKPNSLAGVLEERSVSSRGKHFWRTKRLKGKDLEMYEEYREMFSGLGKPLAERINEWKKKNARIIVLDRDARPIYLALKKLGLDAKLVGITRDILPKQLVDAARQSKSISEIDEAIKQNFYFEGSPEAKRIDALIRKHLPKDKTRHLVFLDSGYKGTAPRFLKFRALLNGYKNVEDWVLFQNVGNKGKESLRVMEFLIDSGLGKIKYTDMGVRYEKSAPNKSRKELDLAMLALADEIIDAVRGLRVKNKASSTS